MFSQLLSYLLEASVCLGVFYLFFRLLLQKEVFFVWNRMYILTALVISLAIPVINIPLQSSKTTLIQQVFIIQLQDTAVTRVSPSDYLNWQQVLLWMYLGICCLLICRLLYRTFSLWQISRKLRSSSAASYRLVLTEGKLPTFSFFRLLFWDNSRELSEENKLQVFKHELTHIRQWHSADVLFIELIKAFFWFHPAVYLFKQALQQVHEYLADSAVVQQHNTGRYIKLLVSQLLYSNTISISTPFHQPPIKNRIMMLEKLKQATPAFWKMALSLPVMAALIFMYSCDQTEITEPALKVEVTDEAINNNQNNGLSARKGGLIVPSDILNKYRDKYPDIALKQILVEKPVQAKSKDEISSVTVEVENVSNADDKRNIEEEISQALTARNTLVPPPPPAPDAPLADEIFQVVEEQPTPVRGYDAFLKYIGENIQYPQQARLKGTQGKVFVQFVVYNDGTVADVQILQGLGDGCDQEAVRVIANAPKWNPGKQNGKPVNVRMSVPINFKLD